jgi:hypothetical protein
MKADVRRVMTAIQKQSLLLCRWRKEKKDNKDAKLDFISWRKKYTIL